MGGLKSAPKPKPPPPPVAVVPMPDPEDTNKGARIAQERAKSRTGRESTMLTDQSGGKLGA